ncbi:allophanate hydrolase [Arcobacter sp.]|uniref:allophanate hydrolase n=1 Tax=unclassified Arcobacter TaxID=2593671 RepID=UPI003B008056
MLSNQLFDIKSIHDSYKKGVTPKDIVTEVYNRIKKVNDDGIFIHLQPIEDIFAQTSSLEKMNLSEKPLWGIPFTVKDNIDVEGIPTTAACPAYEYIAKEDAFIVKVLKQAGAICIGKTNLDQFATGLVGIRTPYGAPKNALDEKIIPGGSSCGSAVAVSHQLFSFSLGTDTAGSGRIPAALNNLVGLKPTLGAFSKRGVVPACLTVDAVSVFALNIEDAYDIFEIASKHDQKDPYSKKRPKNKYKNTQDVVVAIPNSDSQIFIDDEIQRKSYQETISLIKEKGFKTIEIDLKPFFEVAQLLYEGTWLAERYTVIGDMIKNQPADILDITRTLIQKAETFSASDVYRDIYRFNELKKEIEPVLEQFDILCLPSMPRVASVKEIEDDPIKANSRLGIYTNFVNLLDLSAIAIPVNKREDGFAGGVTIIANAFEELMLAKFAKYIQKDMTLTYGNSKVEVKLSDDDTFGVTYDEIEVAVVGTHLRGMPLNKDLVKLNARFLYEAKTTPNYKLFKLQDEEILKPGLIQDENGVSIELEVWAIPIENLGEFERTIPKPLCIGSIELENKKTVKGFLCEASALIGAKDISSFGGWKAFLNSNQIKG